MTDIYLHGMLGQKFGKKFQFSICRPRDVFRAIETCCEGFSQELINLSTKGFQYSLVVDGETVSSEGELQKKGKIKEINIVPVVYGAGVAALAVGVVALAAGVFAGGTATLIGSLLFTVAFSAISFGLQSLLAKPPKANAISQAASTATTAATSKSFLFSNRENVAGQGFPVPLGYGRLRVGSAVIQESVKSYPNSNSTFDEFASQSTQQGQSHMSIIHNQNL
ncbi:MAG: hypothetical protein FMNOHCHN_02064 [Ignavibacteriaceae bacterium]|nr:hypothetical protein [Ignavibacteriaceae bacterium]